MAVTSRVFSGSTIRFARTILLLWLTGLLMSGNALAAPSAVTPSGTFSGVEEGGVLVFKGIRYAEAPTGSRRWQAPMPAGVARKALEAKTFGPACLQPKSDQLPDATTSEDCLFLNVWTLDLDRTKLRPVMVWIHGGGFRTGSGAIPGEVFASQDVVVVSLNYRLGPLGFMAHKSLRNKVANVALLDMVAALDWVKNNIQAFGGSPHNVTLFGVSAGGQAVNLLMVSPLAARRFHRAIAQSGYAAWALPRSAGAPAPAPKGADLGPAQSAEAIAESLIAGLDGGEQSARLLRRLDGQALVEGVQGFQMPIVDGTSLPEEPGALFRQGRQAPVPYMTGGNSFEGSVMPGSGISAPDFERMLGADLPALKQAWADDFAISQERGLTRIFGDNRYLLSARLLATAMAGVKKESWLYYVALSPTQRPTEWPGTPHGYDYALLFGTDKNTNTSVHNLGIRMQQYWLAFARRGRPDVPGLAAWPAYIAETDRWMVFSDRDGEQAGVLREKLDLLTNRYEQRFR
ncbi:MAG: carboxylesterase family protein [Gammaproteobacteria bacterium]|nr:carboxylesterase family protein [Gammaproteobacteria bacterium]